MIWAVLTWALALIVSVPGSMLQFFFARNENDPKNSMVYEMGQTIDTTALLNNYQSTVNFYQSTAKFQKFTANFKSTTNIFQSLNLSGHTP